MKNYLLLFDQKEMQLNGASTVLGYGVVLTSFIIGKSFFFFRFLKVKTQRKLLKAVGAKGFFVLQ